MDQFLRWGQARLSGTDGSVSTEVTATSATITMAASVAGYVGYRARLAIPDGYGKVRSVLGLLGENTSVTDIMVRDLGVALWEAQDELMRPSLWQRFKNLFTSSKVVVERIQTTLSFPSPCNTSTNTPKAGRHHRQLRKLAPNIMGQLTTRVGDLAYRLKCLRTLARLLLRCGCVNVCVHGSDRGVDQARE